MEEDIIALISGLIDGRNDMLRRINRFNYRDTVFNAFLMNELRYLELINRVHQSHIRTNAAAATTAAALFTLAGSAGPGGTPNFFDTIPIIPTAAQLQQATAIVIDPPANSMCAICQDAITTNGTQIRHCGHMYHRDCFNQWFSMSVRCPVCRHDVRTPPSQVPAPTDPAPQTAPGVE